MANSDGDAASRDLGGSLRIALVSEQIGTPAVPNGAPCPTRARRVAELADALAAAGHEVRLYGRLGDEAGGPASPRTQSALLSYTRRFGEQLAQRWRDGEWTPDLVHAHHWLGGMAAMAAMAAMATRRTTAVPVVLTFHEVGAPRADTPGTAQPPPEDARVERERELGSMVGLVIAQSRAELNELARRGVPRQRIVLVPAGFDPDNFAPEGPLAPRHRGPHQLVAVGSADQLAERKGFTDLIEALRHLRDAELTILGGPAPDQVDRDPQVRRLRALADQCRVGDRVRFTGRVPPADMPGWYRRADLVVNAAWYAPVGIAVVEAMASGVPVVATAVGGPRDTVVDSITGVLVPPRQPATLGRAIRSLLADPIRRMEYAAAGLDRARQCYAWDRVTGQMEGQYRLLVG